MATVEWDAPAGGVRLIDQTKLPGEEISVLCRSAAEVAGAIREMVVRGAPAIGAAAAFGAAIAARDGDFEAGAAAIRSARPTARDLFWAVDLVEAAYRRAGAEAALEEAQRIAAESVAQCRAIGRHGAELVPPRGRIVTICNAGALATVDYGTAFGVMRAAHEEGKEVFVYAMETRPRAQGARLTAWELQKQGIPFALIADSAIGLLLQRGMVASPSPGPTASAPTATWSTRSAPIRWRSSAASTASPSTSPRPRARSTPPPRPVRARRSKSATRPR